MADKTKCVLCSSASILVILTTSYLLVYRPPVIDSENQPITRQLTDKYQSQPTKKDDSQSGKSQASQLTSKLVS